MAENTSTSAKNKLEDQACRKGDISYSYWTNKSAPANSDVQPMRLSEASQQQEQPAGDGSHAASTWNKAGTFEERDVSAWAKERIEGMVVGTSTACGSSQAIITRCRSITGSANIWFIRGNKRSGFDFQLELEWKQGSSTADAREPGGTLKVPSASPDDLDDLHVEVSIDTPTGDTAVDDAARQAAKQLKQPLQELFEQFLTELRSR